MKNKHAQRITMQMRAEMDKWQRERKPITKLPAQPAYRGYSVVPRDHQDSTQSLLALVMGR